MSWNYRVIEGPVEKSTDGEMYIPYGVHEVYYSGNETPTHMSAHEVDLRFFSEKGESNEEVIKQMRIDIGHMLEALDKPILSHKLFL